MKWASVLVASACALSVCASGHDAVPGVVPHPPHASSPALQIIDVVNQVVNNVYDDQAADDRKYLPVWNKCQDKMKSYKGKLIEADKSMEHGTGLIKRAMDRMLEADRSIEATTKALMAAREAAAHSARIVDDAIKVHNQRAEQHEAHQRQMEKTKRVVEKLTQFLNGFMSSSHNVAVAPAAGARASDGETSFVEVWREAHATLRGGMGKNSTLATSLEAVGLSKDKPPAFSPGALKKALSALQAHVKAVEADQAAIHASTIRRHEALKGVLSKQQQYSSQAVKTLTNRLLNAEQARRDAVRAIADQKSKEKSIQGRQGSLLDGVRDAFQGAYLQCHMLKEAYDLRKAHREENAMHARKVRDAVKAKLEHIAKAMSRGASMGEVEDRPDLVPPVPLDLHTVGEPGSAVSAGPGGSGSGPCPDCDDVEKDVLGAKSVAEMDMKLDALKKEEIELRERRAKMLEAEEKGTGA